MEESIYNIFNAIENENESKALDLFKTQSDFKDKNNKTVLMMACENTLHKLIDKILETPVDINARDNKGYNALYYACSKEDIKTIDKLVKAGIDLDNISINLETVLVYTIVHGHNKATEKLMNYDMEFDYTDYLKRSAFMWACLLNDETIALKLLEKNIQIDRKDDNGNTALAFCIKNKNLNLLNKLKQKDLDFSLSTPIYKNILHYAAYTSSPEILNFLLHSEDINVTDDKYKTALFIACDKKKTDNAVFLLANGATFDQTKADGLIIFKYIVENCLNTLLTFSSLEQLHEYKKLLIQQQNFHKFHIEQIDKTILKHDLSNQLLDQPKITKTLKI